MTSRSSSRFHCLLAGPLRHVRAINALGLLRGLRRAWHRQPTTGLALQLAGCQPGEAPPERFPRSPPSGRRASRPALPRQHRHAYAAGFNVASPPASKDRLRSRRPEAACAAPGPHPPGWSRWNPYGTSGTGSSRTASRLACRTRAVWKCLHVPSLSGLLPPPRASPRISCPQLHRPAATGRRQGSFTPARLTVAPRGAPRSCSTWRCRAACGRP